MRMILFDMKLNTSSSSD